MYYCTVQSYCIYCTVHCFAVVIDLARICEGRHCMYCIVQYCTVLYYCTWYSIVLCYGAPCAVICGVAEALSEKRSLIVPLQFAGEADGNLLDINPSYGSRSMGMVPGSLSDGDITALRFCSSLEQSMCAACTKADHL